jgi:hypothetical protein
MIVIVGPRYWALDLDAMTVWPSMRWGERVRIRVHGSLVLVFMRGMGAEKRDIGGREEEGKEGAEEEDEEEEAEERAVKDDREGHGWKERRHDRKGRCRSKHNSGK